MTGRRLAALRGPSLALLLSLLGIAQVIAIMGLTCGNAQDRVFQIHKGSSLEGAKGIHLDSRPWEMRVSRSEARRPISTSGPRAGSDRRRVQAVDSARRHPAVITTRLSGIALAIATCESGDGHGSVSWTARNPSSTASGAFQFLDSTWTSVTGLAPPASAYPPDVQIDAFWTLYGEQGTAPWVSSQSCWG
jgi:hypothetical protein